MLVMLEVKNVSLGYGPNIVVQNVSLRLAQGEIGCLLGPSIPQNVWKIVTL